MKMLFIFTLILWAHPSFSKGEAKEANKEPVQAREVSKKQIMEGCIKSATQVPDVKKKICECVVTNFDMKVNDYDLETLAKDYTTPVDKNEPVTGSTLTTLDHEVADSCIKNPKYRLTIDPEDKQMANTSANKTKKK